MSRQISLLSKGLFNKPFMDSRVKTRSMTKKELVLGHLVGPLGMILVINVVGALAELYYTEQVPIDTIYGSGTYQAMCMARQIIAVFVGVAVGLVMQHTKSKQGRMRPWLLLSGLLMISTATIGFIVPKSMAADKTYLALIMLSFVLYTSVGYTVYNFITGVNGGVSAMTGLITRSFKERTDVGFFRKMSVTIISGILIGLVLMSVIYYRFLINNRDAWWKLILGLCVCAIPLLFIEYFWTKERVTEDAQAREEAMHHETKYPLKDQFKALITDKYYMLFLVFNIIMMCLEQMKGGNVNTNFCRWVLGANAQNNLQMIYTIVSGIPLGIGAMAVYPLVRKLGVRKLGMIGWGVETVCNVIGLLIPQNPIAVMAVGFVKNMARIPYSFVTLSIFASSLDNVEYRTGMRLDGMLGVTIIGMIQSLIQSPFAGLYETILLKKGFNATLAAQPVGVTNWIRFCFWGIDAIIAVVGIIVFAFYDIEKKLPIINEELLRRRREATIANGEEWIEPEELDRMEKEENEREAEINRVADLKARCEKKGLDFDTENKKYLDALAEKQAKAEEKQRAKDAKIAEKNAKKAMKAEKKG